MVKLLVQGLGKNFGPTRALHDVSMEVSGGKVLALLGENGAGKSTLIKILAGIHSPDSGSVLLDDEPVHFKSPAQALRAGIVVVPQELRIAPNLSVAENILLGQLPTRKAAGLLPMVDRPAMRRTAAALLERLQIELGPDETAGGLGFAERQLVVIARALGHQAKVLILDEPTASLEQREAERLFSVIHRLRDQGVAIIYISHRLEEVPRLADACLVLRDGQVAARIEAPPFPAADLVRAMTGGEMKALESVARKHGEPRLELPLADAAVVCRQGQVLGLGGLLGSGTAALLHRIFGSAERGRRGWRDTPVKKAIGRGLGLVPGERARALVMSMSVRDNIVLPHLHKYSTRFARDEQGIDAAVERLMTLLDIRPRNPKLKVSQLSGGNQQKVALAKWLGEHLEVLLLDEPTNGIDIAAKALIHERIQAFAAEGGSVILSSTDLPELLGLSDAIVVLRNGRYVGQLSRSDETRDTPPFNEQELRGMMGIGS